MLWFDCKICTTCYPNRKKSVYQKLSMKILGIGNAIVDVICKINDKFIEENNLTKSTMNYFLMKMNSKIY